MSDEWGNREYVPDRHPMTSRRRARVPSTAAAQQAYLLIGAVALTVAVVSGLFERIGALEIGRGVYAILAGLFVVGGHGWTVCRAESRVRRELGDKVAEAESRVRRELGDKVAELTTVLAELRDLVEQQRVIYLPPPAKQNDGARHLSAAVGGQGTAAPGSQRTGLDPETIAAARALARRIADGPPVDQDG